MFVVVAGGGSVLFRDLAAMLSPFVDGFVSGASLLSFVVGLILIAVAAHVYLLFAPDARGLVHSLAQVAGRQPPPHCMAAVNGPARRDRWDPLLRLRPQLAGRYRVL